MVGNHKDSPHLLSGFELWRPGLQGLGRAGTGTFPTLMLPELVVRGLGVRHVGWAEAALANYSFFACWFPSGMNGILEYFLPIWQLDHPAPFMCITI